MEQEGEEHRGREGTGANSLRWLGFLSFIFVSYFCVGFKLADVKRMMSRMLVSGSSSTRASSSIIHQENLDMLSLI